MHPLLRLLLLVAVHLPALATEVAPWSRLTIGMSGPDAIALLGEPILTSKGRGFERWTYDDGAEVLLYGSVVGWTAPAAAKLALRSEDLWRNAPAGKHYATLHAALRDPARLPAVAGGLPTGPKRTARAAAGVGFEEYFRG